MNTPKVIDRRVAWLDAVSVDVVEVLAKLTHRNLVVWNLQNMKKV